MRSKPNAPDGAAAKSDTEDRGGSTQASSPALIGMSLRQDIPGGLLSSRARFRFSCRDHSETKDARSQQKRSEQRTVPSFRVSKLDTSHLRSPSRLVTELVTEIRFTLEFGECRLAFMQA